MCDGLSHFVVQKSGMVPGLKLKDKVAIITGSGRGIGREIALAYAEEGADIVVTSRTMSEIESVAGEISKLGRRSLPIPCDVTKEEQVELLFKKALAAFQRIDILVNNAGAAIDCLIAELSLKDWLKVIDTNLTGTFLCCREVTPIMKSQGGGIIINMLGRGSHLGSVREGMASYCSSKAAIETFTRVLALEVAPYNIRAINLHPNQPIATRMTLPLAHHGDGLELRPPAVVRAAAVFVASEDSKNLNGEYVSVREWNEKYGIKA